MSLLRSQKNSGLVKLPLWKRIELASGKSRSLIYLPQILLTILVSTVLTFAVINIYIRITNSSTLFTDPVFTSLLGSLLGACVGAFVGGTISLQLHKETLRATSAIKEKDQIYTVLYDGLASFRSQIVKDRYSLTFILSMSDVRVNTLNPKFLEWDQIKNDSRFVQIPKWLREIFDCYLKQFDEYARLKNEAITNITATKEEWLQKLGLHYFAIPGGDESYLLGILTNNEFYLNHGLRFEDSDNLDKIDIGVIEKRVIDKCEALPIVHKMRSFYESNLVKNTDELLHILELVIRYINSKYEYQDDLI